MQQNQIVHAQLLDERLTGYLRELVPARSELLEQMEGMAKKEFIPILDLEATTFLRLLLRLGNPKRILEIGTAIGYSAVFMAQNAPDARILTMERDEMRVRTARSWIRKADLETRISIWEGDAFELLKQLKETANEWQGQAFDLIFLDAAKGQYAKFLEEVLPLLAKGGILLSDNVLFQGYVMQEGQVKHKLRTMVNRLREYNWLLAHHSELDTTFLPLGDGMAVSMRKNKCLYGNISHTL
ncbi:O-methyltransferase [Fodinisporobacter ferrooxydans]|uniref:tRNA 5-hydroxyuridine methyltransferase n=1 Tax=Fodinisporobacter ferrooxydans TaxID=2901836 RepID=A0ABY4CFP1_9BACL|nr:O-methyltransferase [Alicyclobacillaceae bacterium MYW30-H2]